MFKEINSKKHNKKLYIEGCAPWSISHIPDAQSLKCGQMNLKRVQVVSQLCQGRTANDTPDMTTTSNKTW